MIDWHTSAILVGIMVSATITTIAALHLRIARNPVRIRSTHGRQSAGKTRTRKKKAMRQVDWPAAWSHEAPARPLTIAEAHDEMQWHRLCRIEDCARKAAAFAALVEGGRVKPDSTRQRR